MGHLNKVIQQKIESGVPTFSVKVSVSNEALTLVAYGASLSKMTLELEDQTAKTR